jgi:hypothetical protein
MWRRSEYRRNDDERGRGGYTYLNFKKQVCRARDILLLIQG